MTERHELEKITYPIPEERPHLGVILEMGTYDPPPEYRVTPMPSADKDSG